MKLSAPIIAFSLAMSSANVVAMEIWDSLFKEKLLQAEKGSADAQFEVGAMYENGRGVDADRIVATDWYRKASEQGHTRAAGALARMEDNERRFQKTQQEAEAGDIEAQYSLGNMYATGTGVQADIGMAQLWLRRAASVGHTKAQFKLGHLYYVGLGKDRDNKSAFDWFGKAAANDYAPAHFYLGDMYASGAGVKQDFDQARTWYSKASAAGFAPADKALKELDQHIAEERERRLAEAEEARLAAAQAQAAKATAIAAEGAARVKAPEPPPTPRERLLSAQWQHDDIPAAFLPSKISQCKASSGDVVCYTRALPRQDAPEQRYRVKAIIRNFTPDGEFNVVYRELVLQALPDGEPENESSSEQENTARTGWLEPHRLTCRFSDDKKLSCEIDGGSVAEFQGV